MNEISCRFCGAPQNYVDEDQIFTCAYCGRTQSAPSFTSERIKNTFQRANELFMDIEFDRAAQLYERIIEENPDFSEAYWRLCLCKYGVEYVDDTGTNTKIPTCQRTQIKSIFDDADYIKALKTAKNDKGRKIIEEEARYIDSVQKKILEISADEKPYDIFISYKKTDDNNRNTPDSFIAQSLYNELTENGYRVFFAGISLEDKIGQQYEPYIFSALNSASIMLLIGTKIEYIESAWVRNEWSRYLKLIEQGQKKRIIVCYSGIDPYNFPEELSALKLQAQDLNKIGYEQDLLRGIEKLIGKKNIINTPQPEKNTLSSEEKNLLKKAFLFIEDGVSKDNKELIKKAADIADKILQKDPDCSDAYIIRLLTEYNAASLDELVKKGILFDDNINYKNAVRTGNTDIQKYNQKSMYISALDSAQKAEQINFRESAEKLEMFLSGNKFASSLFKKLNNYKDSETQLNQCLEKRYNALTSLINNNCSTDEFLIIYTGLHELNYKDSSEKSDALISRIYECGCSIVNTIDNKKTNEVKIYSELYCAKKCFTVIGAYKDAEVKITECEKKLEKIFTDYIKNCYEIDDINKFQNELDSMNEFECLNRIKDLCQIRTEELKKLSPLYQKVRNSLTIGYSGGDLRQFLLDNTIKDYAQHTAYKIGTDFFKKTLIKQDDDTTLYHYQKENKEYFEKSYGLFDALGTYKDSKEKSKLCKQTLQIKEEKLNRIKKYEKLSGAISFISVLFFLIFAVCLLSVNTLNSSALSFIIMAIPVIIMLLLAELHRYKSNFKDILLGKSTYTENSSLAYPVFTYIGFVSFAVFSLKLVNDKFNNGSNNVSTLILPAIIELMILIVIRIVLKKLFNSHAEKKIDYILNENKTLEKIYTYFRKEDNL